MSVFVVVAAFQTVFSQFSIPIPAGVGGSAKAPPDDPLGSQGPIALSDDQRCVFAVNAGSNTITSFLIQQSNNRNIRNNNNNNNNNNNESTDAGLKRVGVYDTDGDFPVSVTVHDRLVYVLNAGEDASISGFRVNTATCQLTAINRSTKSLSLEGDNPPLFVVSPAQISFTPNGDFLIVVIKGEDDGTILVFPVLASGRTGTVQETVSEGFTPFGFDFDDNGNLLLTEAFGRAEQHPILTFELNTGAVTSYTIDDDSGSLEVISASVGNGQSATCWIQYSGTCAYTTNNVGNSLSSYYVSDNGELEVAHDVAFELNAPEGLVVVDEYLYVLSTGHSLAEGEVTDQGQEVGQPALYVFEVEDGSCDVTLRQVVLEGLPTEFVTEFSASGVAAF